MTPEELESNLISWGHAKVYQPLTGGYRNQAWLVELDGQRKVAKTTRRGEAAIAWLGEVHAAAEAAGFVVPRLVLNQHGRFVENGLTVEAYIEGDPATSVDLQGLAARVAQFHQKTAHLPQRPSFASSAQLLDQDAGGDVDLASMPAALVAACRDAWTALMDSPQSVVHGDLNLSNILITSEGTPALIDWDESRVDASLFDMLAIHQAESHTTEEARALLAWEIAVCWHAEHDYAQNLARKL